MSTSQNYLGKGGNATFSGQKATKARSMNPNQDERHDPATATLPPRLRSLEVNITFSLQADTHGSSEFSVLNEALGHYSSHLVDLIITNAERGNKEYVRQLRSQYDQLDGILSELMFTLCNDENERVARFNQKGGLAR
ncbi:hypothetical protein BLX24_25125 [Arsenicibacter rosenii]|uniref:Uncharacterized protein n=2 Tax=Arsenicibacter rosenii TaxID=1750698 RepID=A0A1S2VCB1_9BACT|nr:hypothetical protein BLX24_25125 [Arsenicibacter rosenii]